MKKGGEKSIELVLLVGTWWNINSTWALEEAERQVIES